MSNNKTSKTLLNETQIRQFMKLAQLEPLSSGFIDERRETRPPGHAATSTRGRSDKPIPGTDLMAEEEDPAELEGDITHDLGDDSLEGDEEALGDEEEIAGEEPAEDEGGDRTIQVKDFLAALESALEDVMGEEVEMDTSAMEDEAAVDDAAVDLDADADMDMDMDVEVDDELELQEDKAYTAKKEKPGADKRKGAEKRGAEGTLAKTKGHGKVDYVNEDEDYTAKKEKPGADKRKGAEKRGAEGTLAKTKGHGKVDYVNEASDDLVEQITKRVAARILKTALKK